MNKDLLRKEILSQRIKFLNSESYKSICNKISENICFFLEKFEDKSIVGGYHAIKGEVDLAGLYNKIENLAFPRLVFIRGSSEIEYAKISSVNELTKSKLSFMEPSSTAQICYPDILLIPGIAFDTQKRRIGYGKGHFDKFLSHAKKSGYNPLKIGISFDFQLQQSLPHEAHDQDMDYIITESTII